MKITAAHQLYSTALEKITGKDRRRLNGSALAAYNAGVASPLLLYVEPVFDSSTHKVDALVDNGDGTCTKTVVAKTQAEMDADLQREREGMVLTPRQFRRMLNSVNKRQQVEDYIAGLSQDDKDDWLFATEVERLYPLTIAMIQELGYNDTQADNFFRNAVTL